MPQIERPFASEFMVPAQASAVMVEASMDTTEIFPPDCRRLGSMDQTEGMQTVHFGKSSRMGRFRFAGYLSNLRPQSFPARSGLGRKRQNAYSWIFLLERVQS